MVLRRGERRSDRAATDHDTDDERQPDQGDDALLRHDDLPIDPTTSSSYSYVVKEVKSCGGYIAGPCFRTVAWVPDAQVWLRSRTGSRSRMARGITNGVVRCRQARGRTQANQSGNRGCGTRSTGNGVRAVPS